MDDSLPSPPPPLSSASSTNPTTGDVVVSPSSSALVPPPQPPEAESKRPRIHNESITDSFTPTTTTPTTTTGTTMETGSDDPVAQAEASTLDLVAKWRSEQIELTAMPLTCTIQELKLLLQARTRVKPEKQKLIGLNIKGKPAPDITPLGGLTLGNKKPVKFILMGTPEEEKFIDPSEMEELPEVFDDFELEGGPASDQWRRSVRNSENLKKFTASTEVHLINPPRPGKRLLVLDLDHTLLDFSSRNTNSSGPPIATSMKRPHLDSFLCAVYPYYDLVAWSQTSWRWLEIKLTELGMLHHPGYRFCFVLDKTSMFHVTSTKSDGSIFKHQVKPLQIIWSKFQQFWGPHNTVHIDDLSRNFQLNPEQGIKIRAYYRNEAGAHLDVELGLLGAYLVKIAQATEDFTALDHKTWRDSHR